MADQDSAFPSLGSAAAQPQTKKSQQPQPKKKKQKGIALDDFLAEQSGGTGSWADEMEALPTGPSARDSGAATEFGVRPSALGGPRDDMRSSYPSRGDFGDRPAYAERPEIPLPTSPPFTAFVGNLSFDTSDGELGDFFASSTDRIVSIRVVAGHDGKPKGFAYVEFGSLDDLKAALGLSGSQLAGRTVRVSVAEPPKRGGFDDRSNVSEWRRDGPLPPASGRQSSYSRGGERGEYRQSYVEEDPDRWSSARGSKFVPSEAPSDFGRSRRNFSSESFPSGNFERGSKFSPSESGTNTPSESRRSSAFANAAPIGEADTANTWRRATPLPPTSSTTPSQPGSPKQSSPATVSAPPTERKRLQLAPRSTSQAGGAVSPPLSSGASTKPNPFGAAAPVDTAEKERQMEARLEKMRLEQSEKAEKDKEQKSSWTSRAPSGSGSSSSPFGNAKPVDTNSKDRAVEAKITERKSSQSQDKPVKIMSNPRTREGFSFANIAKGNPNFADGNDEESTSVPISDEKQETETKSVPQVNGSSEVDASAGDA